MGSEAHGLCALGKIPEAIITNFTYQKKKAVFPKKNDLSAIWLPGLVSQSVLLWDGVRLEMKRALKGHVKTNLLSQRIPIDDAPPYASMC